MLDLRCFLAGFEAADAAARAILLIFAFDMEVGRGILLKVSTGLTDLRGPGAQRVIHVAKPRRQLVEPPKVRLI